MISDESIVFCFLASALNTQLLSLLYAGAHFNQTFDSAFILCCSIHCGGSLFFLIKHNFSFLKEELEEFLSSTSCI